jgi:hypothetical protein
VKIIHHQHIMVVLNPLQQIAFLWASEITRLCMGDVTLLRMFGTKLGESRANGATNFGRSASLLRGSLCRSGRRSKVVSDSVPEVTLVRNLTTFHMDHYVIRNHSSAQHRFPAIAWTGDCNDGVSLLNRSAQVTL